MDILIHILADVFNVNALWVLLHALVEYLIRALDLRKKCLNSRKN